MKFGVQMGGSQTVHLQRIALAQDGSCPGFRCRIGDFD
jgi:hypothetical protein